MLFPTVEFAIFFPVVLALSWLLMPRQKLWKPYIIIASYVFYAAANPKFCLLLAGITLGNQAAAKLIAAAGNERVCVARQCRNSDSGRSYPKNNSSPPSPLSTTVTC